MNFSRFLSILCLSAALFVTTLVFASGEHDEDEHGHVEVEPAKGPHGGRLLTQDDFALEVTHVIRAVVSGRCRPTASGDKSVNRFLAT